MYLYTLCKHSVDWRVRTIWLIHYAGLWLHCQWHCLACVKQSDKRPDKGRDQAHAHTHAHTHSHSGIRAVPQFSEKQATLLLKCCHIALFVRAYCILFAHILKCICATFYLCMHIPISTCVCVCVLRSCWLCSPCVVCCFAILTFVDNLYTHFYLFHCCCCFCCYCSWFGCRCCCRCCCASQSANLFCC